MSATPQTAVAVIEQSPDAVVEWNLDNWPIGKFNRLIPTQTLGLPTDLIRPFVQVVQLDIETDTYSSSDLKQGHRAPNVRGLSILADAAGVDFVDEVRLDDLTNPDRAYVRVYAEMVDATGRKRRAPGSRDYVLASQPMTDAQRKRARGFVHEHAATRARHRALRALLSLPQSYPVAELAKPFAVVRFLPNHQNPEIRAAVIAAMVPTVSALYGAAPAQQLAAGPDVVEVPEFDEPRNVTPAGDGSTAQSAPAAAAADEVPDWAKPSGATTTGAQLPRPLSEALAELVEASGLKGPAQNPAKDRVAALVGGVLDWATEILPVLQRAFGEDHDGRLSAAQANAIAVAADSYQSVEDFLEAWRQAAS